MTDYFRAVTLGAFTWKNEIRIAQLFEQIRKAGSAWLLLHFVLLTFCLNFPVMFQIARLSPFELYSRLYGENFPYSLPDPARAILMESPQIEAAAVENFNMFMLESGYGTNVLLPLLGMIFIVVLIIQAVFYLVAVLFLSLSRINFTPLSFREKMGLALYSSTLPVLGAAIFGMIFLPAVHIIIYYLAVIFFIFQRSNNYIHA